jgi:hypothetical protein
MNRIGRRTIIRLRHWLEAHKANNAPIACGRGQEVCEVDEMSLIIRRKR